MTTRNSFCKLHFAAAFTVAAMTLTLGSAGCGSGPGDMESKMTSYSTGQTKADTEIGRAHV